MECLPLALKIELERGIYIQVLSIVTSEKDVNFFVYALCITTVHVF